MINFVQPPWTVFKDLNISKDSGVPNTSGYLWKLVGSYPKTEKVC